MKDHSLTEYHLKEMATQISAKWTIQKSGSIKYTIITATSHYKYVLKIVKTVKFTHMFQIFEWSVNHLNVSNGTPDSPTAE